MSHYEIVIERDEDHVLHIMADARSGLQDAGDVSEELGNIEDGTWTPYGVTVARVCDCCDNIEEEYVSALWGVVVETSNQEGRYALTELGRIEDDYLREVAGEVLADAPDLAGE